MTDLTQQVHEDPFAEGRQSMLQAMSALVTVFEAAARYAAVGVQDRAAEAERQAQREDQAARMQQQANRLRAAEQRETDRYARQIAEANRPLRERGTLFEAAEAWRWGTVHGDTPVGRQTAADALHRLRHLAPDLVDGYERRCRAGVAPHEAMADAAVDWWEQQHAAEPQPGRPSRRQLTHVPDAVDEFDQAVRAQVAVLARDVDPAAVAAFQADLRRQNMVAADGLDLLLQFTVEQAKTMPADTELLVGRAIERAYRADGRTAAGALDRPATAADEHTEGQVAAKVLDADADQVAASIGRHHNASGSPRAVSAQAFPPLRLAAPGAQLRPTPAGGPGRAPHRTGPRR
ncbi:hypothetical protein ACWT_5812 [Actinoplanes sp. SE50]|uniref:hypothetical protein n=1 Tax=unclassified Actinoplanes TaxID=2626549 RepID=UPI00023EBC0F|nr:MULTISPECIES: hypothetical protein [unclassified Actinoplanes]AEV86830.1 hypothetical protein ACPL_5943 [Actinoplanes sp. SE50/110]ATO85227.1 hypothetical protein ACWT_5812 [Actinoplanes sp. SE50]SLM02637.1 hypothetical protein ACSP50_5919 [Actinoplanes sp. SE50/110]